MQKNKLFILITFILTGLLLSGCAGGTAPDLSSDPSVESAGVMSSAVVEDYNEVMNTGGLLVHHIDVGQGDSILIQLSSGENILIDAGEVDKGDIVLNYLKSQQVEKLDILIATHPHSDHIGGMKTIVDNLDIGKIYMPRASHTTQTYENLLLSIKNKGLKISEAKAGVELELADMFEARFIAPNSSNYESLNDYSAVLKLKYKDHGFLFTGDAEDISGQEILSNNHDVKATVLDAPHHGSTNSLLNEKFLKKVSPQVAVISAGKDNRYGHPHKEILEMLDNYGVQVLRTDIDGNIVIVSDGNKLKVNKNQSTSNEEVVVPDSQVQYIGNKNSKIFHLPSCKSLPAEHNRQYFDNQSEAIDNGYKPCQNCKP
ncbi:MAG TPA: MBL fold metallo-hydrolase [Syntrophomonadaceae bacterium]|nr:MBL fold metallo-hydrolase [Syntrophomonadaceae bacterium]